MEKMTLISKMEVSTERIEEIFSNLKIKEWLEKLLKKNEEQIISLQKSFKEIFFNESEDFRKAKIEMKIKNYILSDSLEIVIKEGKSFNQAILKRLKEEYKEETAESCKKVAKEIEEMRLQILMMDILIDD